MQQDLTSCYIETSQIRHLSTPRNLRTGLMGMVESSMSFSYLMTDKLWKEVYKNEPR